MIDHHETLKKIKELERQAEVVLDSKRRTLARRPIVIEFSGAPKSGKSTCIPSLDIFLRRNSFKTKVLTERASVCPIENKFDPLFNVWNGCAALNQLSEIISNRPKDYDVIIMDRGFFDSLCWFEWQKSNGFLGDEDYRRFVEFFSADRFRTMVDLVIHFDAIPKTSMDREYKNLLTRKEGSVMRDHVLQGYRAAAKKAETKYGKQFRQFVRFETDDHGQNEVSMMVTELVLDKLRDVAREKICFVDRGVLEAVFAERNKVKFSELRSVLNDSISFDDRDRVESDSSKVQLIPIAVLKDKKKFQFIVARKGKQATSANSPESNRILLYFGGHVREEDKTLFDSTEVFDILSQCLFRELKEELGIDVRQPDLDPICIWHRDGTRSEMHMAIGYVEERDLEYTRLNIDEREFVKLTRKERYGTGALIDGSGINSEFSRIDPWSKAILEEKFGDVNSWQAQSDLLE